jgi:hypothetical protein
MRIAIAACLTGVAIVSLAACSKPAAGNGTQTAASGAAGAAGATGAMPISQFPHRKPGLWRQVMAMEGVAAGPGTQLCVDEASEAKLVALGQQGAAGLHCPPATFTRNPDGTIGFSETCDLGATGKTTTTGVIRGDFNSSYTEDMSTQFSGGSTPASSGVHKMTITATWTGPCAPGQRGGDMIFANGMKRNMLDDRPASAGGE